MNTLGKVALAAAGIGAILLVASGGDKEDSPSSGGNNSGAGNNAGGALLGFEPRSSNNYSVSIVGQERAFGTVKGPDEIKGDGEIVVYKFVDGAGLAELAKFRPGSSVVYTFVRKGDVKPPIGSPPLAVQPATLLAVEQL